MTKKQQAIFLLTEILTSSENDIKPVLGLYCSHNLNKEPKIGFFAVPRLIFPEIDGLGCYYAGKIDGTSKNAINFIKEYFGRVNSIYKNRGSFLYFVYRHGLMHQHIPKTIIMDGKVFGWGISISSDEVSTNCMHLQVINGNIQIDANRFYEDFSKALKIFIDDVKNETNDVLAINIIQAHKEMYNSQDTVNIINKYKYMCKDDFLFLNEVR